ncbi:reverse transcriptase domain-containing protein [Tanacetum coccineum]
MDQEKTTFTCPFGTYAYRRMPFRLCNAPATFQRCMLAIFHDMIEESVEVFMDDFSVFGNSFNKCINNLDKMLHRCKDAHLVLNWEKCHFIVKEGIVLGHKVSGAGHEVDKAKNQRKATKVWHDRKLGMRKEFKHGNKVLLFHSKYKFKQPKLRSCWLGSYVVKHQYPSGYVELYGKDGKKFIVNGHRLKLYHEEEDYNDQREAVTPFFPKE